MQAFSTKETVDSSLLSASSSTTQFNFPEADFDVCEIPEKFSKMTTGATENSNEIGASLFKLERNSGDDNDDNNEADSQNQIDDKSIVKVKTEYDFSFPLSGNLRASRSNSEVFWKEVCYFLK